MNDQTEKNFQMMIYLMLVFFCVDMGFEILAGLNILSAPQAITTAHDSFIAFFGIAVGMFRGMAPQGSIGDTSNPAAKTTITTEIHAEKETPATQP